MRHFAIAESVVGKLRLNSGVSRVELSRQLAIAPSTIGIHVDRLVGEGFLREGPQIRSGAGRPPTVVELNPGAGQFIGVDLDAREIYGVCVDFAQQLIGERVEPIGAGDHADDVVSGIAAVIDSVRDTKQELLGIGLAVPGVVDVERGIGRHYEFIDGWKDIEIAQRISSRFHVPVAIENNIRSMALAERWFGIASQIENFVSLGVRSGIGAGVFIDGELYRGQAGLAGEIGSWPLAGQASHADGLAGDRMTLEKVASLRAIQQRVAELKTSESTADVTIESVLNRAEQNDRAVLEIFDRAADAIGLVVAQLSLVLNPQQIIVCGPLAGLRDVFIEPLQRATASALAHAHAQCPRVVGSTLGQNIGALGAAACAAHQWRHSSSPSVSK